MVIKYDLEDIFNLLICAEFYGFGDDILYSSLIKPMNVTVKHIDDFISDKYGNDKYTDEDRLGYKDVLLALIKKYK